MFQPLDFVKVLFGPNPPITSLPSSAVAANLATEIIRSCEAGSYQKDRLEELAQKSLLLANTLEEISHVEEGQVQQDRVDQVIRVLERTRKSAQTWQGRNRITKWVFQRNMGRRVHQCLQDLDDTLRAIGTGRLGQIATIFQSQDAAKFQKNPGAPGGPEGSEGGRRIWTAVTDYEAEMGNSNLASSETEHLTSHHGAVISDAGPSVRGDVNVEAGRTNQTATVPPLEARPSNPRLTGPTSHYLQGGKEHDGGLDKSKERAYETGQDKEHRIFLETRYDCAKVEVLGGDEVGKLELVKDEEVMTYFDGFDPDQVIRDRTCFYVTFDGPDSARKAQQTFSSQSKTLAFLPVLLSVIPAPFLPSPTHLPLSHPAHSQISTHESVPIESENHDAPDHSTNSTPNSSYVAPMSPPHNYDACRSLLLQFVMQNAPIRRRLVDLVTEKDAQSIVDFLDEVLGNQKDLSINESKRVLHFLESVAKSFQVFPARCELKDLQFDPGKPLYEGGYGYVCRGIYENTTVCVKVVRLSQDSAENNVKNLKAQAKEFAIWAHLLHPNIVPFFGIHLSNEYRLCLISPWMQRGDLKRFLRTFPATPRLPLLADVIFGLQYLHESNVIHADIKANNVIVSDTGRAMIADFGISRVAMTCVTSTDASKGTPRWTAPELVRSTEARPSPESDIWSFACLCYEVLTGRVPFHQFKTDIQIVIALLKGGVNPLGQYPKDNVDEIDASLRKLLENCWSYNPEERPSAANIVRFFEDLNLSPLEKNNDLDLGLAQITRPKIEINYSQVFEILQDLQRMQET